MKTRDTGVNSVGITFVSSFVKIGQLAQKFNMWVDRQRYDFITLLFFRKKGSSSLLELLQTDRQA